jgi:hypothetical protein
MPNTDEYNKGIFKIPYFRELWERPSVRGKKMGIFSLEMENA